MYIVKLNDGTEIKNLTLNGNNFVSQTEILDSVFEDNLETVTITNTDTDEVTTFNNAFLVQNQKYEDGWYFILAEKTREQLIVEDITNIEMALAEVYEIILGNLE